MSECPIVETSLGKVKGTVINNLDQGRDIFRYSSLPFAKPPVGELRFEPPVEPASWNGILDGTKHSASPLQHLQDWSHFTEFFPDPNNFLITNVNEDCLYLSVYTTTTSKTANLPVLFWIYGGGFALGSEVSYNGSMLAAIHDVVVVVPNYRASVFGFLSLGCNSEIPGNVGLLDQLMAMKWTREHINNFGGNPNNITIFGESAGGVSVSYHMVSSMSHGYFDKAISHSGTLHQGDFLQEANLESINLLGIELKLDEKEPQKIAKQLKSLPAGDIMKAALALAKKMVFFLPTIDGKFLTKNRNGLSQDKFHPVPYIVGCNNSEGCGIMSMEQPKNFSKGITEEACKEVLKGFVGNIIYKGLPDSVFDLIIKEYSKDMADNEMKWSRIYGEVLGDLMFVFPAYQTLKQHKKTKSKTYMYVMTQVLEYNHNSNYGPECARKPSFCKCDHGDDMIFTFGMPLMRKSASCFTENEKDLSKEWMKYIVNFAKNGDPNSGESVQVKWPEYNTEEQTYLSVQQPCSIGKNFSADRYRFWENLIAPMNSAL